MQNQTYTLLVSSHVSRIGRDTHSEYSSTGSEVQTNTEIRPCATDRPSLTLPTLARSRTATELECLVTMIVTTINARDFSFESPDGAEFRSRIAPNFEASFDCYPSSLTFGQQARVWRQAAEACPNVEFRVANISSAVHNNGGKARVFLHLEMRGYDNVQLQGICEWQWELVRGKWLTHRFTAARGPYDVENVGNVRLK